MRAIGNACAILTEEGKQVSNSLSRPVESHHDETSCNSRAFWCDRCGQGPIEPGQRCGWCGRRAPRRKDLPGGQNAPATEPSDREVSIRDQRMAED
jgi:hypothetical protein